MLRLQKLAAVTIMFALLLSQSACDKSKLVSWSEKAVSGLNKALPILQNAGVNVARVQEAIGIGNQLIIAFKANDNETALGLTSSFIVAFEAIVRDTERIGNPATRTLALAILAVVDLAIHFIADELAEDAPQMSPGLRQSPGMARLAQYRTKAKFRCRNAVNGQFAKMEFCEKNPTISVVETR